MSEPLTDAELQEIRSRHAWTEEWSTKGVIESIERAHVDRAALLAEVDRLRTDRDTLMRYIDEAKIAAQEMGRVTGEPLADFLRRFHEAYPEVTM